jgi:hypothetical protein
MNRFGKELYPGGYKKFCVNRMRPTSANRILFFATTYFVQTRTICRQKLNDYALEVHRL